LNGVTVGKNEPTASPWHPAMPSRTSLDFEG